MAANMQFQLISSFPDFRDQDFVLESYNQQFRNKNVLIHAEANHISYPEHWGPLSIKTAFKGNEYYRINNCEFAVNDKNYLVLNDGNYYSSYINSTNRVESFTINFCRDLVREVRTTCTASDEFLLDNFNYVRQDQVEFYEILNAHDQLVSPLIFKLRGLTKDFSQNIQKIEEIYLVLLEKLMLKQLELEEEVLNVPAIKLSTKKELYKRLTRARDFIDSCYYKDITIAELASISFLHQTYFLRQFKRYFMITPGQYIINKRMEAAKCLLHSIKNISITDVCTTVGYNDLSSFSKLFKSYYFVSPELYRRNLNNETLPSYS